MNHSRHSCFACATSTSLSTTSARSVRTAPFGDDRIHPGAAGPPATAWREAVTRSGRLFLAPLQTIGTARAVRTRVFSGGCLCPLAAAATGDLRSGVTAPSVNERPGGGRRHQCLWAKANVRRHCGWRTDSRESGRPGGGWWGSSPTPPLPTQGAGPDERRCADARRPLQERRGSRRARTLSRSKQHVDARPQNAGQLDEPNAGGERVRGQRRRSRHNGDRRIPARSWSWQGGCGSGDNLARLVREAG
jgi:hypothetical protein